LIAVRPPKRIDNDDEYPAPESECTGGRKSFFWADDSNFGGHALRRGSVACGLLL
jgi:hypothetical protein